MATAKIELPPKLIPVFAGDADVRGAYGGRKSGPRAPIKVDFYGLNGRKTDLIMPQ